MIWELLLVQLKIGQGRVEDLSFSPDGEWLAAAGSEHIVYLWGTKQLGRASLLLRSHTDWVEALAFSPDSKWLATGSRDHTVRLWDLQDPTRIPRIFHGHERSISNVLFSSDGRWVASDGEVPRLWSLVGNTQEPLMLTGHQNAVEAVAFSPNGKQLATGDNENSILLWNLETPGARPRVLRWYDRIMGDAAHAIVYSPGWAMACKRPLILKSQALGFT